MEIYEAVKQSFQRHNIDPLPDIGLLLVGSNPLPVYALVQALNPTTVLLLGTGKVDPYVQNLEEMFKKENRNVIKAACAPSNWQEIKNNMNELLKKINGNKVWFSYTAGTKAMSVHGYEECKNCSNSFSPYHGIYLSPYGPTVNFDYHESFILAPNNYYHVPELSLNTLIYLHNNKETKIKNLHKDSTCKELAKKIHAFVIQESIHEYVNLLPPSYLSKTEVCMDKNFSPLIAKGEITFLTSDKNYKNFKDDSYLTLFSMQNWSKKVINNDNLAILDDIIRSYFDNNFDSLNSKEKKKSRYQCLKWLVAGWLEVWIADVLKHSGFFHEVCDSYEFQIPNTELTSEVDVCGMRGVTPFIFSCTIDDGSRLGKGKLFEVRQRANQLGGEHTRSAVVCLSTYPEKIENQLNEGWSGYDTIKVFGRDALKDEQTFIQKVKEWIDKLEKGGR